MSVWNWLIMLKDNLYPGLKPSTDFQEFERLLTLKGAGMQKA